MKAGIIGTFSALKWIGQRKSSHYLRCTGLQTDGSLIIYKLNLRLANERNTKLGFLWEYLKCHRERIADAVT